MKRFLINSNNVHEISNPGLQLYNSIGFKFLKPVIMIWDLYSTWYFQSLFSKQPDIIIEIHVHEYIVNNSSLSYVIEMNIKEYKFNILPEIFNLLQIFINFFDTVNY